MVQKVKLGYIYRWQWPLERKENGPGQRKQRGFNAVLKKEKITEGNES